MQMNLQSADPGLLVIQGAVVVSARRLNRPRQHRHCKRSIGQYQSFTSASKSNDHRLATSGTQPPWHNDLNSNRMSQVRSEQLAVDSSSLNSELIRD